MIPDLRPYRSAGTNHHGDFNTEELVYAIRDATSNRGTLPLAEGPAGCHPARHDRLAWGGKP
jgi:hypothetical protein